MALTSSIVSRYSRYKAGQTKVVKWLTTTAGRLHDLSTYLSCLNPANARSEAAHDEPRKLKSHELVGLAKIVAIADPPVTIPAEVLRLLEDVISGRREANDFYTAKATDPNVALAASNSGHAVFIEKLERVKQLLSRLDTEEVQINTGKSPKTKSKKNDDLNLTNIFEYLELEQPLADNGSATPKAPAVAHQSEFVLDDDESNDVFAIWCYLTDMRDVRAFPRAAWTDFNNGTLSLETAAVITETATGMLQYLYDDFSTANPQYKGWSTMLSLLRIGFAMNKNIVYLYTNADSAAAQRPGSGVSVPELLCPSAYKLMAVWPLAVNQLLLGSVMDRGSTQKATAPLCYAKVNMPLQHFVDGKPTARPMTDFESVLFSMAPEVVAHACHELRDKMRGITQSSNKVVNYLADIIVGKVNRTEEPPSWLVVATAILMDVHEAVGGHGSCGIDGFHNSGRRIADSLNRCIELYKIVPSGRFRHNVDQYVKPLHRAVLALLEPVEAERTATWRSPEEAFEFKRAFPGLNCLPHVAGNFGYHSKVKWHQVCTSIAHDEQGILLMAHLYKAAMRYGLCQSWPDMDFVIAQHSNSKPFVTKTHAAADSYAMLRHYMIDLGYDAASLAKNRIPQPPACGPQGHKAKNLSVICSPLRAALQEALIENDRLGLGRSDFDILQAVLRALVSTATNTKSDKGRPSTQKHYSPTQLLSTLRSHLIEDEPRLNFDYSGFSRLCIDPFVEHYYKCASRYCDAPEGSDKCAHKAFYYYLKTAADAKERNTPISETPLGIFAKSLQSLITTDGKKFSQAAFDQSSGRIPKSLRPNLPQFKDMSAEKQAILESLPGASLGPSHRVIELYDANGSMGKADQILMSPLLRPLMLGKPGNTFVNHFSSIESKDTASPVGGVPKNVKFFSDDDLLKMEREYMESLDEKGRNLLKDSSDAWTKSLMKWKK